MNSAEIIQSVFQDEVFVKGLLVMETPQEVQTALAERGVQLSVAEIIQIRDYLVAKAANGEELSEAELENVAGGFASILIIGPLMAIVIGGAIGTSGAAVGVSALIVNNLNGGTW